MNFVSTRAGDPVSLDQAMLRGIAADGGLFVPDHWPTFSLQQFAGADTIDAVASIFLRPFFAGSRLAGELDTIVEETFCFPIPTRTLPMAGGNASMLELFHGPTAAFKDVGARFLAACMVRLQKGGEQPLTILVATSGDTGGAVAAAFDNRPGMRVVVLFPHGRVSPRQERQLTCWGDNVLSLAVRGSFDDCQELVKAMMSDPDSRAEYRFSSANSINIGRLLPQCTYYADASLRHFRRTGRKASFIVPTGNLGNGFACIAARHAGLPIGNIILATNANRLIADFLQGSKWRPRASIATLATAMDVGYPSNMERLRHLLGDADSLSKALRAGTVNDDEIREQIRKDFRRFGFAVCPHTATATCAYDRLRESERVNEDWILVATAHAAKFEAVVEPLIGAIVPVPEALAKILSRPSRAITIEPELRSLNDALQHRFAA
jgi:threonine synthase